MAQTIPKNPYKLTKRKCLYCKKLFQPVSYLRKYCSQDCCRKDRIGRESKRKNGKKIKCKFCGKLFYISKSRFGKKKYCSRECGQNDNWGFKPRKRKCVICGQEFIIENPLRARKKTCSPECHYELQKEISRKRGNQKFKRVCADCGELYESGRYVVGGLCKKCRTARMSKNRKGKGNPAYRHGLRSGSVYSGEHLRACARYRKKILKEKKRIFCESCKTEKALRFEVHHICSAARFPKHPALHNTENLILLCVQCHNDFHAYRRKEEWINLVRDRKLDKMFGFNLNYYIKKYGRKN